MSDPHQARGVVAVGLATLAVLLLALGTWAGNVPLARAVVTGGEVLPARPPAPVQAVLSGRVAAVLRENGARVAAGAPLLRLASPETDARLAAIAREAAELSVRMARLTAWRDEAPELALPSSPAAGATRQELVALVPGQRAQLAADRATEAAERAALDARARRVERDHQALFTELAALDDDIAVLQREEERSRTLVEKRLAPERQALEAGRAVARAERARREAVRELARLAGEAEAIAAERRALSGRRRAQAEAALRDHAFRLRQLTAEHAVLAEEKARTVIAAPAAGRLHAATGWAAGQVVRAGEVLAEIVPEAPSTRVALRAPARQAGDVAPGRTVRVGRADRPRAAPIDGVVTASAPDGEGGLRLEVALASPLPVGLPVNGTLVLSERTALEAVAAPLLAYFAPALR